MMRKILVLLALVGWTAGAVAFDWVNLTPENRLGGRMVSPGYLRGKVVLLDCRDYGDKTNFEAIRSLQKIWATYKTKPFVIVGSHRGPQSAKRMAAILERLGVTYPVYADVALDGLPIKGAGSMVFVIDSTGTQRLFSGVDVHKASGVVGSAIFATRMPGNAKQWKLQLDYEIEHLPGRAYLRLKDLHKPAWEQARADLIREFPEDARRYEAVYEKFKASNEIKKLAKFVELARLVKDRDPDSKEAQKITKSAIENAIEKNESLKDSTNPFVVQEAKNAIADLMFVAATLSK